MKTILSIITKLYLRYVYGSFPNLQGDRDIEYASIATNIPNGPGKAMDFGSGNSYLSLIAAEKGYNATNVDMLPNRLSFRNHNVKFIQGDFFECDFKRNSFDLMINCSSIEHVGLVGRYGVVKQEKDGDLKAMAILHNLLRKGGIMLLTVPVGKDKVFLPKHRVYGKTRLPKLLSGFKIVKHVFWTKNNENRWIKTTRKKALLLTTSEHFYNIGFFVLAK